MGLPVDFLDVDIYNPVDRLEDRFKNSNQPPIHRPNTGSRRQRLAPLRVCVGLPEVRDNSEGVSPAPPLPLSHSVRQQLNNE